MGFTVVALLVVFLLLKFEERLGAQREARKRAGEGFDITPVARRLQQVRRDYVAAVCARPRHRIRRRSLAAAANCALKQRAFFRNARRPTAPPPAREPSTPL